MLNGQQVGDVLNYDDKTGIIYWDIPYQEGKLEVVGMDKDNHELCRYALQTSGRPFALTAQTDLDRISNNLGLAQIVVQVVDEKGVPVMISEDEVTCTIDGPAQLKGLEASNNTDMGNYSDNVQRVYHGRLLAYIQATGKKGVIRLNFSAPWLKDASLVIEVY